MSGSSSWRFSVGRYDGSPPVIYSTNMAQAMLYSYVVDHDTGHAPNPYFGVCTLCRCKFREPWQQRRNVVELADVGDWVIGTGGADTRKSAGHGKLVYAMRVDEKLTREQYFADHRFKKKKRVIDGSYAQQQGDNIQPTNDFERHQQFALISRRFYYFGANAIAIPRQFSDLEKKGPWFKNQFKLEDVNGFLKWLEANCRPGKHGEPCQSELKECQKAKSSC